MHSYFNKGTYKYWNATNELLLFNIHKSQKSQISFFRNRDRVFNTLLERYLNESKDVRIVKNVLEVCMLHEKLTV